MRGEFIDLDGERIYYYAAGTRGAGDPVVLIHGFPTSSHLWTDVVPKVPAGHRVIVIDLLGFGRSDAPPAADYSIAGHGTRMIRLLDALRVDRACVTGHDIGGQIASWMATHHSSRVSGLAIIDGTSGWIASGHLRRTARALVLHLPSWCWLPFVRRAIAARYADVEHGHRSAEIYLMPFLAPGGGRVLQRHIDAIVDDQGTAGTHDAPCPVPTLSLGSRPREVAPEEAPSEVAALIAALLAR